MNWVSQQQPKQPSLTLCCHRHDVRCMADRHTLSVPPGDDWLACQGGQKLLSSLEHLRQSQGALSTLSSLGTPPQHRKVPARHIADAVLAAPATPAAAMASACLARCPANTHLSAALCSCTTYSKRRPPSMTVNASCLSREESCRSNAMCK